MTMTAGAEGVNTSIVGQSPTISLNGSAFSEAQMGRLLSLEIENAVGRPDLCEIRLLHEMDDRGTPANDVEVAWVPGAEVKVQFGNKIVFQGEITSVDVEGSKDSNTEVVLLAFDKRHRMYRREQVKVFKDSSYGDVVRSLLGEIGLQHDVSGLPAEPMKYYLHEGTVGDLVDRLCDQFGLYFLFRDGKVLIKKSSELKTDAGVLRSTAELLEYRFRQTTSADRAKAEVRGWDPKQKQEIVGTGARSAALPGGGLVESLDSTAAFSEQVLRHTTFVSSQKEAAARAVGALSNNVDAGIQMDGVALFSPTLAAGALVKVEDVPKRFAGKYRLTSVRHRVDNIDGARSMITCRGADDTTLTGLLEQAVLGGASAGALAPGHGLQPAIVVNVKSAPGDGALGSEGAAGEVKVKLPWLGEAIESGWLRVVAPGGGKDRGFLLMPEIEDEVLVAFHDGDMRSGYVLGGLYNGKDAAPRSAALLTDGKVIQERVWRSRSGHEIVLGDKQGEEYLQLVLGDKKTRIRMDKKNTKLTIESTNVIITPDGKVEIVSDGAMTLTAKTEMKLEAANITLKAQQKVSIEGGTQVSINGTAGAELKGAKVDINSQGPATVKGNPIMLN